jgi:hypothetical protein
MTNFKLGDRVGQPVDKSDVSYAGENVEQYFGTIVEVTPNESEDLFKIKWDGESCHSYLNSKCFKASSLLSEEECKKHNNQLMAEFSEMHEKIKAQMKIAADAILEANSIAEDNNLELPNMHNSLGPLIGAMEDIGWSTSSLSC